MILSSSAATEEQKREFLPAAAEGCLGAFALTEAGAESTDAGGLTTKAVYADGHYVLNGTKCFISNMGPHEGHHVVVIAVTDKEKGTRGGMTAFLMKRDTPGFSLGKTEEKMGDPRRRCVGADFYGLRCAGIVRAAVVSATDLRSL